MTELIFFILGIGFTYVVEPMLEKLMCFILTALDVATGSLHIKLTQQRKVIEQIQEGTITTAKTFSIGFAAPTEDETMEEENVEDG